ncbi:MULTISPECIES: hypothetical protein [unclassified Clostridioides]|uniref:hypothetical protein n=1 Tax=unclassified Clostridioides TaxID=2635829 RepID=UPI001D128F75|nr:hypothetical protein [Clostridioides sp. ES-S-0145-01]MCC0681865.1 hypothetical protein [Clostridioides sp. ES-S-0005-03]MCC0709385.1 hypothetical protein [Clostridioides sp. ES-S-0190-01]UDN64060.1 hypothetical protein IC758_19485 [Clostridioides sp. ES-W-0016-02]
MNYERLLKCLKKAGLEKGIEENQTEVLCCEGVKQTGWALQEARGDEFHLFKEKKN